MLLQQMEDTIKKNYSALDRAIQAQGYSDLSADSKGILDALGMTPNDVAELERESFHYCQYGEWGKAEQCLVYLTLLEPLQQKHSLRLGSILLTEGKFKEALSVLQAASVLDPADPRPLLFMGNCFLRLKENEKAKQAFDLCIEMADLSPEKDLQEVKNLAKEALLTIK